jgi:hypothetical protein
MAVKTLPAHPKPLAGNPSKWIEHAKERGQENLSIHALEQYSSASKMEFLQFLPLRILWKQKHASAFYSRDWFSQSARNDAARFLESHPSWDKYLKAVSQQLTHAPVEDIGTFSIVAYFQAKVTELDPAKQWETQKLFPFSPVAGRTRSQTANQALSQTPCKTHRGNNNKDRAKLDQPKDEEVEDEEAEDDDTEGEESEGEDVEDEEAKDKGVGDEAEGEDMEDDVDLTEVTNKFSSVRVRSTSNLTPWSAIAAGELSPTKDEQIVNTALLLFLSTTTIHHPGVKLDWSLERRAFKFSKLFKANVDGVLLTRAAAIAEVKPCIRETKKERIQLQESAQMAAWINSDPEHGHMYKEKDNTMMR